MPIVTYPRATWRLQTEQEAVPVCEEEKTEPFVFRTAFMTCYFEKLVIVVNRNLCGYCINNVGHTQSLHMFTKTSLQLEHIFTLNGWNQVMNSRGGTTHKLVNTTWMVHVK